ncbi:bifunctional 2-polyprenyl-6-hydroxyphenol methylase/3-demethylubiquinol 3-O-methyltransferase UbiG [Lewinella sp. JB7]|uniref:class I SAM-dependent methyltransferase n=1 Tax=Lewinella sp. JB7 TaxID=2962887 RepID=UPI0020C9998D|nr:class I SAM-dependent methyltransferase [Lewinella sp. JB7]MCP9237343.1 class I SAM-dependent methyltransferase [Lewinella sp. JB7]
MIRLILIILSCLPVSVFAQNQQISHQELLERLAIYRSELLRTNSKSVSDLKQVEREWEGIGIGPRKFAVLARDIVHMKEASRLPNYYVLKNIVKVYGNYIPAEEITESDVEVIAANYQLIDLITVDVLGEKPPYVLNKNTQLYKELAFYGIEASERIAEIGAGNGTFSLILAVLNKDLRIAVNELDKKYLEYIDRKLSASRESLAREKITVVRGSKKSVELTEGSYDKIIVRNSFHHFKRQDAMLQSIQAALTPEGLLYVNEPVQETDPYGEVCDELMKRREVIAAIEANGFRLAGEERVGDRVLMRYTKS